MVKINEIQILNQYKKQIDDLVKKKAKIIGELSPSGSYINQLISERNEYEKELNESTDYIKTNLSGVVSTRIDGYESSLIASALDNITYTQLEQSKIRTDEIVTNSTKSIKIVDNYFCYLVVKITDEHKNMIQLGDMIKFRFNYGQVDKVMAEVVKITEDESSKTVFFKITQNVEELINYRKVSFDIIWWEYEGLKVPNIAINGQSNNATVILCKYGIEYPVRVKILKQNKEYSIITDLSQSDIEELNLSAEDVKKSITIYDELVIKK